MLFRFPVQEGQVGTASSTLSSEDSNLNQYSQARVQQPTNSPGTQSCDERQMHHSNSTSTFPTDKQPYSNYHNPKIHHSTSSPAVSGATGGVDTDTAAPNTSFSSQTSFVQHQSDGPCELRRKPLKDSMDVEPPTSGMYSLTLNPKPCKYIYLCPVCLYSVLTPKFSLQCGFGNILMYLKKKTALILLKVSQTLTRRSFCQSI